MKFLFAFVMFISMITQVFASNGCKVNGVVSCSNCRFEESCLAATGCGWVTNYQTDPPSQNCALKVKVDGNKLKSNKFKNSKD